jgi:hypothetical protein
VKAIHADHEAPTRLYLGEKKISQLQPYGSGAYLVPQGGGEFGIERVGVRVFALDLNSIPHFVFGYARITSSQSWYVTLNETAGGVRKFVTIGTVRFQAPGVWDAYCGLNGHARQFGYATGPHAGLGAVALLLGFGNCAAM